MADNAALEVPGRAWADRGAHLHFWTTAVAVVVLDLASKWWAFSILSENKSMVIWSGLLSFTLQKNQGAVFGLGQGGRWIFVVATLAALLFILQLFAKSRPDQRTFHSLLALGLGGAMGNLYDRLIHGVVRDFIMITAKITIRDRDLTLWPWVFNVADVALVLGIGLLLAGWISGRIDIHGTCAPGNSVDTD